MRHIAIRTAKSGPRLLSGTRRNYRSGMVYGGVFYFTVVTWALRRSYGAVLVGTTSVGARGVGNYVKTRSVSESLIRRYKTESESAGEII